MSRVCAGFKAFDVGEKGLVPMLVAQLEAAEVAFTVGCINSDNPKVGELGGNHSPFGVGVAVAIALYIEPLDDVGRKTVDILDGWGFAKDGGAAVALFDCTKKVFGVLRQVKLDLPPLGFGFLQAQDVGIVIGDEFLKQPFTQYGPQTIYIPTIEFHTLSILDYR